MTEEEVDTFHKLFLGIKERTIPDEALFPEILAQRSLGDASELVKTGRLTISEDPLAAASKIPRVADECALCGVVPASLERKPATLHLHFANAGGLGLGVWVHTECLSRCPMTEQQRGIPW